MWQAMLFTVSEFSFVEEQAIHNLGARASKMWRGSRN
jgi:hypothetical protein